MRGPSHKPVVGYILRNEGTGIWNRVSKFWNCFQVLSDPSDPDPVMAGAVARILKRVGLPPLGVLDVISIGSLPVLAYIYFRQEKQFAWLDEQEKRVNATVADMRARGIIRDHPSDPDPVMAGAVARILKRVGLPPLGVLDVISIGSLPVLAYIYFRQEKQFAWLDEQEKRVNATVADMRARGIIRDR
ncbi:hypothetical protein IGI04_027448 [Brassica rapa subsp. trilocularis]|uniref:Uncharacterized protein n=1 Tax=Brassica rapa subsp. trilocularis TaxID=1813537 RepID=A0ABQ7KZ56_BRACM|nr:hypothetical protein IGI04_027448 [Brassica rapa subsp. trilocularis]